MNLSNYLQAYIAKNICSGQEFKSADLYVLCDEYGFTHKAIGVGCGRLSKTGFLKIVRTEKRKIGCIEKRSNSTILNIYVYTGAEITQAKKRISKAREDYLTADKRLKTMEEASVNLAAVFANIKPQQYAGSAQ